MFIVGACVIGVWYVAFAAWSISLVLNGNARLHHPEIARLHPEGPLRVPRCFGRRHLRNPLLFVWPGLLWPFFFVFSFLRMKLDQRRVRNNDHDPGNDGNNNHNIGNDENNDHNLGNDGNNEGAAPPPAPPPAPLP